MLSEEWRKHKTWYDSEGNAYRNRRWYDEPRYVLITILLCTSPLVLVFADNFQKQLDIIEKLPTLTCEELESGLVKMTPQGREYSPSGQAAFDEWAKRCINNGSES